MEKNTKSWGPFTGRQLTTIFCAVLLAAVMVPVGSYALSFTNVAITDPRGSNQAKVDGAGNLAVSGTVTARPAPPAALVRGNRSVSACTPIVAPPSGKALVLTSVHVNVYQNPTPGFANNVLLFAAPGCAGSLVDVVNPAGIGVTALDYGNGLAIPANGGLFATVQGGVRAEVYANGYTVASSQVSATSVAPPAVRKDSSPSNTGP
jgi:hypothetical protein